MRRFLDWTAAQTSANQTSVATTATTSTTKTKTTTTTTSNSRHNSHHNLGQHQTYSMSRQSSNPAKDLELQHLQKLLHEIKYYQASSSPLPSAAGSQNQREFVEKVHKTLPLFLNIFGNGLQSASGSLFMPNEVLQSSRSSVDQFDISHSESATSSSKPNSPLPLREIIHMERFPDLLPFAFTIARLFVSEVRQRASNKHAEDASLAILQFLNFKPSTSIEKLSDQVEENEKVVFQGEESELKNSHISIESTQAQTSSTNELTSQGWNLLMSLNTLALSQNSQIIQLLCDASLPSTLIKCLYLFFDLPISTQVTKADDMDATEGATSQVVNIDFAREVTTGPLIKAFTQLLLQLCSNQAAIDELIKKDDLRLLVGIASSQCLGHNKPWRETAFKTLLAISETMRENFMYLVQNLCIQVYIENLYRINSLGLASIDEFIDMVKTLLEFLYNLDVNNRNQPKFIAPLIEQFKSSRIVDLIEELILKIDDSIKQENSSLTPFGADGDSINYHCHQTSVSSESGVCVDDLRRCAKSLMQSLTIMAKINTSQDSMASIVSLRPLTESRFDMLEQFKMPRPSARNCLLNYDVLRLLKGAWSKCQDSHIIEAILDATISLFNDDKYNYFIYESQQLLVYYMSSNNFCSHPYKVKQKLFKFLEFIIIETNYIPCLELGTLGTIVKKTDSNVDLTLILKTFVACLRFNSRFSDIFRLIGLSEVIIETLIQFMQFEQLNQSVDRIEVLYLLLEASQYLLAGPNNLNCTQFNESGAARHVFNCLSKPEFFHLFVPTHSSSSDDSVAAGPATLPTFKTQTPPLSAHNRSHSSANRRQYWPEPAVTSSKHKPSIKQLQKVAFTIIRQLVLSSAGDEHLANLLGLLARNLDDLKKFETPEEDVSDTESPKHPSPRLNFMFLLSQEVNLKISILKSLMIILKDSHRCRALFRKAGGFIYIVSSLTTLEKSLPSSELVSEEEIELHNQWRKINSRRIWRLIKNSLMTIIVAIRFEPVNLRTFTEEALTKFTEALRRLGCFKSKQITLPLPSGTIHQGHGAYFDCYKSIFLAPPMRDFSTIANDCIKPSEACCQLFRFLYDMSLDMGDGTAELEVELEHQGIVSKTNNCRASISFDQGTSSNIVSIESGVFKRRSQLNKAPKRPPSLDLNTKHTEAATLTFPCITLVILDLVPSCPNEDLMEFVCLVIKSLFKHERNQQLLCEAGMISKLLDLNWRVAITDKSHFLSGVAEYMLEKLTRQSITPKELRTALRLDEPLKCKSLDEIEVTESYDETRLKLSESSNKSGHLATTKTKEKIRTDRIEAFVAMMSDNKSKSDRIQPPFVEFDMSRDNLSFIFMPSIAPVNAKSLPQNASSFLNSTLDVHTSEKHGILGGVGSTERLFPPLNGLTFSSWICIERFPTRSSDSNHNIRLFTIYRGSAATGKEYSCFRIQISALDRSLTASTEEVLLFDNRENKSGFPHDPECNLSIWTPELLHEGKWHHIAVTVNRSTVKQSIISVYIDGEMIHHQRICYISNYVGLTNTGPLGGGTNSNNGGNSAAAFVNAFIGSLPQFRIQLSTQWKQGPCHLIEESLSANFIGVIYSLGPNYIGNFQNAQKLSGIAKSKGNLMAQYDIKHHQTEVVSHKPLVHQQSVAVTSSHTPTHLIRVSSSNLGSPSHPHLSSQTSHSQFSLPEDRIIITIDARATSFMTLSRMRRIYTRFDCRQISRVLGLALHENSTPILLLHNTGVHLNGPSRGVGAVTIGYNHVRCFVPSPMQQTLFNIGGCYILLGLVAQAQTINSLYVSLKTLMTAMKINPNLQTQMDHINGYQTLSVFFWKKKHLLNSDIVKLTFSLVEGSADPVPDWDESTTVYIEQIGALRELICECFDLWLQTNMINLVLEFIYDLISPKFTEIKFNNDISKSRNSELSDMPPATCKTRMKNLKCLRDMDLLPRMLRLLPQYDSKRIDSALLGGNIENSSDNKSSLDIDSVQHFDTKSVYLIKQTVFELLNRTPRQADILYFGQFLASLLPSKGKERPSQTINLRNILLKSLLQMMTNNKQRGVNSAMQEEIVRILGFDWFMLFISGSHLDLETITLGFLNLMIILSNDDLYENFKSKSSANGGWLKEPTFPTMDGKFNIQLLGINVGVFFGLSGRRNSIQQEVLEAPNFYLLTSCLSNLIKLPRIYLMLFLAMMGGFTKLDPFIMDTIGTFDKLKLDILCDCLVGDTHHKRRQTLTGIQFKCYELVVCIVYMLKEIMLNHDSNKVTPDMEALENKENDYNEYPTDIVRFLMYLYNNNQEFQQYCKRSNELIYALCDTLMKPSTKTSDIPGESPGKKSSTHQLTQHQASKQILELSRLIILDTMTDATQNTELGSIEQLQTFEKFSDALSPCPSAQGELVDMLLRQILLMIDSTARHNSIKTIATSGNIIQFQLLLINSTSISQIVTDKIWHNELYSENLSQVLNVIDHQLCLAEQIFKFNEILPRHNPPHAFIMQRVLNRMILFALSRSIQHMSDKMLMLDLLKKIYDNRTIIILNHMHSPQSAEFFVCFAYCLMRIIEENSASSSPVGQQHSIATDKPSSLIERQIVNPSPQNRATDPSISSSSSTSLMLASMAKKVWDAIYQSKKGILAEALDVPLSLPAFTLETSLDLVQLKPDINESCEKFWQNYIESEQKSKRRLFQRQSEPIPGTTASSAVNLISGRLTKVVNAASFVSRVVGATAGTMASNLAGEKQNRIARKDTAIRAAADSSSAMSNNSNQGQSGSTSHSSLTSTTDQNEIFRYHALNKYQVDSAIKAHISIIEDYIETQLSQKNHKLALHKYLCDEWLDTENEILLRERAVFGPDHGTKLDKWCLDLTEGPRRMRKKMVNNTEQFYENYPYRPEQYNPENKSLRYRPPMSYDSHSYYMKTIDLDHHLLEIQEKNPSAERVFETSDTDSQLMPIQCVRQSEIAAEKNQPTTDDDKPQLSISINCPSPIKIPKELASSIESLSSPVSNKRLSVEASSPKPSDGDLDDGDSTSFVDFSPEIEAETNSARESENVDSLSVLRLLEKNERISHMFRCSRVQGLDTYEGLLLFGREHFYLIDGFTLLKTREIKDIDSLPPDAHDPIIPNSTPNILAHSKKTCAKFSFDSIIEVHKRRYLLQPIALEVFSSDGRNTLIVFPRNIRNKVYSRLMTVSTQLTNNAQESLAGQKSNVSVEGGSGLLSNLIGETSVTQRWVRGELSNFQYLMNLNTIAGRSYNDLMQYPIFPWILADYSSDHLDLTKPSTFRDLSRPVGAQTKERLEQFKRRYAEWDDTETPPYHYGTFYSSAMIVASFMVRMEPFTQHFLRLQGGHFDLADRMFHSIHDSWLSASKHNMADIKELVPEFFYLPEFLKNENKYDLGLKQNGMKLDDVILPPWAKSDPREFIRLHRCALESDYVSAHLHEWIDLIFGYKQQGQAAVDAVNVFHHLFYEGNVDIYNTDIDPIKKNAVIGFINNFGQVPKQLFKKPHPVRRVTSSGLCGPNSMPLTPILPSLTSANIANSPQRVLTHYPQALRQTSATFRDLRGPVGQIVPIDKSVVAVEQNKLLIPTEYCRYIAWGHADRSLRLGLYDSEKPIFVWEGSDILSPNEILCCTIPNCRTMITAGTDSLITVWKIEKMKSFSPVLNLYGHVEPITCLASSQAYSLIVSGSRDRTAILWDLNRFTFVRQLGCESQDKLVHRGPISAIAINDSTGDIATCASTWLYLWTINGQLLAQIDSFNISVEQIIDDNKYVPTMNPGQLHILSVCFSQYNEWDLDEVIITGASNGSIVLWSMRYYQSLMSKSEIDESNRKFEQSYVHQEDQEPSESAETKIPHPSKLNSDREVDKSVFESKSKDETPTKTATQPITIQARQRTDTMNSEWVRLSASSTSTIETVPVLRATPSSLNDQSNDEMNPELRSDSFAGESGEFLNDSDKLHAEPPLCSTQVSTVDQTEIESAKDLSINTLNVANFDDQASSTGNLFTNSSDLDGNSMSKANLFLTANDPSLIKFSKSDTSLVDSFVILGDTSNLKQGNHTQQSERVRPQSSAGSHLGLKRLLSHREQERASPRDGSKLLPNHAWRRELYVRKTLRRRNDRTPVTSLAISKDHKTIFVGDAGGEITSYSMT